MTSGYRALKHGAAWLDLSSRGKLSIQGPDRVRIVHALSTNHVEALEAGRGCYSFFLNAQGRVLADANIFSLDDQILIDTEPETRAALFEHIDGYIIADDATVHDFTEDLPAIAIEGPQAEEVLAKAGAPLLVGDYEIAAWPHGFVARVSSTGQPGYLLIVRKESQRDVVAALQQAGAGEATAEDARTVRIENGKPRYGEEITTRYVALETGQDHAVHPQKGCYLGQEVVERVRSRGLLGRVLKPVQFETADPPTAGTKLFSGEMRAGEVVSAVYSPELEAAVGLAYIRLDAAQPDAVFTCDPNNTTVRLRA